jgi:hypothetical protein
MDRRGKLLEEPAAAAKPAARGRLADGAPAMPRTAASNPQEMKSIP